MPRRSRCLFCHNTDLTLEHIWPDWLVQEYKIRVPPARGRFTAERIAPHKDTFRFLAGTILHKERIVCGPCNHEWMSQTEGCAIPILKPLIFDEQPSATLETLDICTIAAWTTLRSMVFDGIALAKHQYYSSSERAWFAQSPSMSPPWNTHIWLLKYAGEPHSAKFHVVNKVVSKSKGIHTLAVLMHRLAIKLVTWKGHDREFDTNSLRAWSQFAVKIWPYNGASIAWPPIQALPREFYETFRYWLAERPR